MRIRWTAGEGLDLTGAPQELRELRALLQAVSQARPSHARLRAEGDGDPTPYAAFLQGLDVRLSNGPVVVRVVGDTELEVTGNPEALSGLASFFQFDEATLPGHHSHVEYYEGHPFISSASEPLVVTVGGEDGQE